MDKKSILNEIKNLLKFGTEKFIDAKSGDNIVRVEADDFAVGLKLLLVSEEGLLPAPEGEHVIEDGRTLVVDAEGTIIEIKEAVVEATPEIEVELGQENFYTWDQCMVDMMDEYGDEEIAGAVCGKIKADGYIMSKDEAIAEGKKFAIETPGMEETKVEISATSSTIDDMVKRFGDLEKRMTDVEEMVKEMFEATKRTAEFSTEVVNKIESFIKDTPAQLEFKSIKDGYKSTITDKKTKAESSIEAIKSLRKK